MARNLPVGAARFVLGAAFLTAPFALAEGCRAPTQITITIDTPTIACESLQGIEIVVTSEPEKAEARIAQGVTTTSVPRCASSSHAGTLVVVPAGGRGAVLVVAGVNARATSCRPENGYRGCIVARRAFSFIEHAQLTIPIGLDVDCLDVPCDARSTCSERTCVSSEVHCTESGCLPPGALEDGGRELVDAGPSPGVDGASDAGGGDPRPDGGADGGPRSCDPPCSTVSSDGPACSAAPGELVCCTGAASGVACHPQSACADRLCCLGREDCPGGTWCCFAQAGAPIAEAACRPLGDCAAGQVLCRPADTCPGGDPCPPAGDGVYGICN
jgi:hypothetical protein